MSGTPDPIIFKNNQAGFEFCCKFGRTDIIEGVAITALVQDSKTLQRRFGYMGDRPYNVFGVKVASDDDGFAALAFCYEKKAVLELGDLVYWVPMAREPDLGTILGTVDPRAVWVGRIVAKVSLKLFLKSGFEIVEEYEHHRTA